MASVTSTAALPAQTVAGRSPDDGRGVLYGVTAYGLWGLFPLFWVLLLPSGPFEVMAHRVLWSLFAVLPVLWVVARRGSSPLGLLRDRRRVTLLGIAAVMIAANWLLFIWGVNNGHVVEVSLGYFVNPLVTVLLGVVVLRERLRVAQWVAVSLGAVSVAVLTVGYGQPPWIAVGLALTFALYGLVKKHVGAGAVESLAVETAILAPVALGYIVVLEATSGGTFGRFGLGHLLLVVAGGFVTVGPLLAFGAAANRVPLSVLGLLQYLTPVLQFLCGVLVFHEQMPPLRWVGFAIVWAALAVLTWDGLRSARRAQVRRRADRATAAAASGVT